MITVTNPADGKPICDLREDEARDVERKYQAARVAQAAWGTAPFAERARVVRRFGELLAAKRDACAKLLSTEVGKPIVQARREVDGVQGRLTYFLAKTDEVLRPETVFQDGKMREEIAYAPLGVIANVSAWNYPYFVGSNVFLPALLTGNAVLYKPSELASLTGIRIGELWQEAGLPQGLFSVVIGGGNVGSVLLSQPIDGVFFTGSYATGVRIAQAVAPKLVRLQLELGGKDPTYVTEDVDVVTAAKSLADGAFYNTGQSCCSVERIYVHERVYDDFLRAFVDEVKTFRVGPPLDEATYIGPLTRAAQVGVLESQAADARAKGGRILLGGARRSGAGNFFEPTVIADARQDMALMRDESFGPIIGLARVGGDEDAVEKMNGSDYGLTAGVYCRDKGRAERLFARVRAGSLYWNCCDRVSPRLPWSGYGHSGVGTTLSQHGIYAFLRVRANHWAAP